MDDFLVIAANAIYVAMGLTALFGMFWVILLMIRIRQKRFSSSAAADQFLDDIRDSLGQRDLNAVADLCDSPGNWSKAVPQLVLVAVQNMDRPMNKLRRLLAEKFERDILASLEYGTSWIATIVKSAPMLGLLGTVLGMINAFAKIASSQGGTDPTKLANDISFALLTTALGLVIAIPLVLAGNLIHIRIGKLQDSVQHDLGVFLEDVEDTQAAGGART
ncbi:MAG: MotA/TolQ/ExbB proton channel family protein [Planctomycetaceae bacterium]|nr:MotA/TolQ/ExbB proton channel family protein [Planctomycetaceae bacterium]